MLARPGSVGRIGAIRLWLGGGVALPALVAAPFADDFEGSSGQLKARTGWAGIFQTNSGTFLNADQLLTIGSGKLTGTATTAASGGYVYHAHAAAYPLMAIDAVASIPTTSTAGRKNNMVDHAQLSGTGTGLSFRVSPQSATSSITGNINYEVFDVDTVRATAGNVVSVLAFPGDSFQRVYTHDGSTLRFELRMNGRPIVENFDVGAYMTTWGLTANGQVGYRADTITGMIDEHTRPGAAAASRRSASSAGGRPTSRHSERLSGYPTSAILHVSLSAVFGELVGCLSVE